MAGLFFSYYNKDMKTLDLIHTHLFPTVVAHCVNTDLALRLLPYAHSVIKTHNNENNGVNYKSTYHVRLPSSILQNEFESFCSDVAYAYWESMGVEDKVTGISTFYSVMNKGSSHKIHAHPNTKLAGVYYLNAPLDGAKIRFYDPRPHTSFIHYNYVSLNTLLYSTYDIEPYSGLFLIFPPWLLHEVLKNNSDNKRTSAVFNIL